ncbi:MAG: tetratricopeptide repeat protein [Planctomycetia bacterium]|nr:tetratricopeptide repeat protein [Planctomycetia bacterium]
MKKIFQKIGTVVLGTGLVCGNMTAELQAQRTPRPSRLATETASPSHPVTASETESRVEKLEKQAIELFQKEEFEKALLVLKQIQELDSTVAPADMILARWFAEVGLEGGLRKQLESAVKDSPTDPEAYIVLAKIAVDESRIAEATLLLGRAQSLLEAYKASPERKKALQQQFLSTLAVFSEEKGDWKAVLGILQVQEKKAPEDLTLKIRMALVYMNLQDPTNALAKLQEAYEQNSQMMPPEAIIAEFYFQEGENEKSLQWMETSLKKYPENFKNQVKGAEILFANGKIKEAQSAVTKVLQLDPQSSEGITLQGNLLLFEGKASEALEKYSQAIDFDSSNPQAGIGYIRALLLQGGEKNSKEALGIASQLVAGFPQSIEFQIHYAWALIANGQKDTGLKLLQQLLPVWNPQQDEACVVAICLADQEDNSLAKNLLKAALEQENTFTLQFYAKQWQEKL